ncbi:MAG: 5'-methylthioadenosine/adenosylhomocysteine nucleosidase [Clostridia bacterium]|nr:5'-methylthioadenosine/adenosylhomocysteine nucleosidase [Clostridia bacterium]
MIGIIAAMEPELCEIREAMTDISVRPVSGMDVYCGRIGNTEVAAAVCGIGKVAAALCAEAMILTFGVTHIINTGVAGALSPDLHVLDIVVADGVVQHDFDLSPLGFAPGHIPAAGGIRIPCDDFLSGHIETCAASLLSVGIHRGCVASGDQFIHTAAEKVRIRSGFSALCCEMEGGAIGEVCAMNGIPFTVLRAISDGADDGAPMSFEAFTVAAAHNSAAVLISALQELTLKECISK